MQTILLTTLIFALAMGAMALGVIFARRPLKGSCGGTGEACACSRAERRRCSSFEPEDRD
ncbi:MAG: DUF539 domain-containing protein [Myxococcota bacterium]|jgi:hypothetical protein|nr:DUF539 domain-containing protein [Myxococcota bacterium]